MFILSDFGNFVRVSETLKIDKDKHNNRCGEVVIHKKDEKEVSFGEVLIKAIQNRK